MTKTTVTGNIQQTLNAHLHFRTQLAFHFQLFSNSITNSIQVIIIPLIHFLVTVNTILIKNILSSRRTNTIDIGKTYFASFIFW